MTTYDTTQEDLQLSTFFFRTTFWPNVVTVISVTKINLNIHISLF